MIFFVIYRWGEKGVLNFGIILLWDGVFFFANFYIDWQWKIIMFENLNILGLDWSIKNFNLGRQKISIVFFWKIVWMYVVQVSFFYYFFLSFWWNFWWIIWAIYGKEIVARDLERKRCSCFNMYIFIQSFHFMHACGIYDLFF